MNLDFTIIITTYNRINELRITLRFLKENFSDVQVIICDDGSTDNTYIKLSKEFDSMQWMTNSSNKGLIYNRNRLLEKVRTPYVISLDDDAHFLTENVLEFAKEYFESHLKCAVASFRIFWGLNPPITTDTIDEPHRVKDFAGGAHAMRMSAWNEIPDYPEWYKFYGEEQFASLQFFKKNWEIHYLPEVLVHHRVEVAERKISKDYITRTRRALHSSWTNYLIFYPIRTIPKNIGSSIYAQLKGKVFKGDFKTGIGIFTALLQLIWKYPSRWKYSDRLTQDELATYNRLSALKIYWDPSMEK